MNVWDTNSGYHFVEILPRVCRSIHENLNEISGTLLKISEQLDQLNKTLKDRKSGTQEDN